LGDAHSTPLTDAYPTASYGYSPQGPFAPQDEDEDNSDENRWLRRQAAPTSGLRRFATRKIKLVQNTVLSVNYPVPSAIKNAIQAKYRANLTGQEAEEFSHLKCNGSYTSINDWH
jgi:chitin synthase